MFGHQSWLIVQIVPPPGDSPDSEANWYAALLYVLVGAVIILLLYVLERRQKAERWRNHLPKELKPSDPKQPTATEGSDQSA